MGNSKEFLTAVEYVQKLKSRPNDSEMLELYGFYKQATVGDVNIERPGMLNVKGRAKWDAWNSRNGLSVLDAEREYVMVVNRLIKAYGV